MKAVLAESLPRAGQLDIGLCSLMTVDHSSPSEQLLLSRWGPWASGANRSQRTQGRSLRLDSGLTHSGAWPPTAEPSSDVLEPRVPQTLHSPSPPVPEADSSARERLGLHSSPSLAPVLPNTQAHALLPPSLPQQLGGAVTPWDWAAPQPIPMQPLSLCPSHPQKSSPPSDFSLATL